MPSKKKNRVISSPKKIDKPKVYKKLLTSPFLWIYYLLMIGFIGYHLYFANRIIPNVYIGNTNVGGMRAEDAFKLIKEKNIPDSEIEIFVGDNYNSTVLSSSVDFRFLPVETT